VKVAGDWTASTVAAGVDPGVDQRFATADDVAAKSPPSELFSRIASITIGGQVRGTPAANDHFGFVAQEIGSLSIDGKKFPLTSGPSNDNVGSEKAKFELGSTGDVTVREIA
jgi:hypothetical protein